MQIDKPICDTHLRLRQMTADDLPLKVQWYNDPEISKTLILDETLELDKTRRWFETAQASPARIDLVIEHCPGGPVGLIGLANIDPQQAAAEIFIVIGEKEYWGRGVMLRAQSLLIAWTFEHLPVRTICALTRVENIASIITNKKLGFQIESTLKEYTRINGRPVDVIRQELRTEDFKHAHP